MHLLIRALLAAKQSFVQAAMIRSSPLSEGSPDLRLLEDLQRVIDLDPVIPDRAFQLRVPKEKRGRADVPGTSVTPG